MVNTFAGKTVVITGSSSGIGAGVAVEFAKLGANIVLTGRNVEQLKSVKDQCLKAGRKENQVTYVAGEITDQKCQTDLIETALKHFKQIDILINNAGMAVAMKSVLETSIDAYDRTMDVNLRSAVKLSLMALPHLVKTKGNIVNISSILGLRPSTGTMAYCISKAGMDMMTKSLAFEMAPHGVRVNSVNPGVIPTGIARDLDVKADEFFETTKKLHPMGRNGEIKEISDAIIFLASSNSGFITGQLLCVDGGVTISGVAF